MLVAESFNNDDLAITMFVPTNAAWEKRLPTLTRPNDISAHDLFSVGKSDALRGIMEYHILSNVIKVIVIFSYKSLQAQFYP